MVLHIYDPLEGTEGFSDWSQMGDTPNSVPIMYVMHVYGIRCAMLGNRSLGGTVASNYKGITLTCKASRLL